MMTSKKHEVGLNSLEVDIDSLKVSLNIFEVGLINLEVGLTISRSASIILRSASKAQRSASTTSQSASTVWRSASRVEVSGNANCQLSFLFEVKKNLKGLPICTKGFQQTLELPLKFTRCNSTSSSSSPSPTVFENHKKVSFKIASEASFVSILS